MRILRGIVGLLLAGAAGAWLQAHFFAPPAISLAQEQALIDQASRDSAYMRENLAVLAERVGALQARATALQNLGQRVAQAAGVADTEPEIQAGLQTYDDMVTPLAEPVSLALDGTASFGATDDSAQALGMQLDALTDQLNARQDGFAMLDVLMTRRAGLQASLPDISPVDFPYTSSSFGWRRNPVTGRHAMHEGLDFAAPRGTPIYAASAGIVTMARRNGAYGNMVELVHGAGLSTRYAHASSLKVKEGDLVEKGQLIALVGTTGRSTGPHLHFEVRMAGHALDPKLFLPENPVDEQLVVQADAAGQTHATQVR